MISEVSGRKANEYSGGLILLISGKLERRADELLIIPSGDLLVVIFVEVKERVCQGIVDNRKINNNETAPEMRTGCVSFCNNIGYKNGLKPERKRFLLIGPEYFLTVA